MRQGGVLAAIGLAGGLALSVIASRYLSAFLFGVSRFDASTFVVTTLALAAIAASYVPARRAVRVDPVDALRAD